MTAAEARKKAIEVSTKDTESQYSIIKGLIYDAANKGEFYCNIYNVPIKQSVKDILVGEGYEIGPTVTNRNEVLTQIRWATKTEYPHIETTTRNF